MTKKLNLAAAAVSEKSQLSSTITAIIKAEAQITSNAFEIEDGFTAHYDHGIIAPEIAPEKYYAFVEQNNTLNQCISAMEVNIDGTGYDITRVDGEEETDDDEENIKALNQFMMEVYPGQSLTTIRRDQRRQAEIAGYACMEVIRNPKDEIVFLRSLESKQMRLMKLGDPVTSTKSMIRGGTEVKVQLLVRERIFVQLNNQKKVYFKEFGATRDLDKTTGKWAVNGDRLPATDRATEIIYTTIHRASTSPYGVPRWLNQLPSVIGSRSAEELNLEYFESGGIPPLMVFIAGGAMAETARKQLEGLLSGRAKDKLKGIVADIQSTSGTLEKGGGVQVTIESFGSEKQQDSMFEKYDDKCEKRVRASFRLPPLFVGKADDYSYASVFASYVLGEAQVFQPERMEWDEVFNNTVMKAMTGGVYKIVSKPLTVADAETNLTALELAMNGQAITKATLIDELNKVGSLNLKHMDDIDGDEFAERVAGSNSRRAGDAPAATPAPANEEADVDADSDDNTDDGTVKMLKTELSELGEIAALQARALTKGISKNDKKDLRIQMSQLNKNELELVTMLTTNRIYASTENDPVGVAELCGCISEHGG